MARPHLDGQLEDGGRGEGGEGDGLGGELLRGEAPQETGSRSTVFAVPGPPTSRLA